MHPFYGFFPIEIILICCKKYSRRFFDKNIGYFLYFSIVCQSCHSVHVNNNIFTNYNCFSSVGSESPTDTVVTVYIQAISPIKRQLSHREDMSATTPREKARL